MHIPKVVGFFTSLGIPLPAFNAYFVQFCLNLLAEPYCFSASGRESSRCRSRSICWWHTSQRTARRYFPSFSDPSKFYASDAYTFLFASMLILIFGPGKTFSIDYSIGYLRRRRAPRPQTLREKSALAT